MDIEMGTIYELNQQLMLQEPPLDPIALNRKIKEVVDFMKKYRYVMLLNHDRRDYTLFDIKTGSTLETDLKETITNRGIIISIDKQENESYEIWIKDKDEAGLDKAYCYLLFDYTQGVIVC